LLLIEIVKLILLVYKIPDKKFNQMLLRYVHFFFKSVLYYINLKYYSNEQGNIIKLVKVVFIMFAINPDLYIYLFVKFLPLYTIPG